MLRKNCLLEHVIEEKIAVSVEVTGRRGERRKQLLDNLGNREDAGNWKREHYVALYVKFILEKTINQS